MGGQLRDLNRGTERLVYARCVWRWLSSWRGEVVGGGMLTVSATVAGQLHERPARRRTGNRRWNWSWSRSSGGAIASVSIIRVCTSCEVTQQTLSRFTPRRNMSDNKGAITLMRCKGVKSRRMDFEVQSHPSIAIHQPTTPHRRCQRQPTRRSPAIARVAYCTDIERALREIQAETPKTPSPLPRVFPPLSRI